MKGISIGLLKFNKQPDAKALISELRKDCIYIIMLPADQRDDFIKALEGIDLSQGPEILVLDEMHLTVAEFSRADNTTHVVKAGSK